MFDGLAAAGGGLLVSTIDGRVLCLTGKADQPLPSAGGPLVVKERGALV